MKFYWCPNTRAVRIAWLLEEAGVPYERVRIDIRDAAQKDDPAFRAASPMGKVPAIEDGTTRLWDSGAICAYIADQYAGTKLAPPIGDPDRGLYLQWLMFNNAALEPAMMEKFTNLQVDPRSCPWGNWDQMLDTLRKGLLRGPWVLGERFTAADVMLGSGCIFLRRFGLVKDDPVLFAYADRCESRPALKRANAFEAQ